MNTMAEHPRDPSFGESSWYACHEPNRPNDAFIVWHYVDCEGCRSRAAFMGIVWPDDPNVAWLNRTMRVGEVS